MIMQTANNQSPERQRRVTQMRNAELGMRNFAILSCATMTLCGCQQPRGELFPVIDPPMVWPRGPETP